MANTVWLILALITSSNVRHVLSLCSSTDFCTLLNTRGISAYNSSIARRPTSMTCERVCSLNSKCIATTVDPTTEHCELHEAGPEGTPCMILTTDEVATFAMLKHRDRSCLEVSWEKIINVSINLYRPIILITVCGCKTMIHRDILVLRLVGRAPSQYKDRLIYVWRFPC